MRKVSMLGKITCSKQRKRLKFGSNKLLLPLEVYYLSMFIFRLRIWWIRTAQVPNAQLARRAWVRIHIETLSGVPRVLPWQDLSQWSSTPELNIWTTKSWLALLHQGLALAWVWFPTWPGNSQAVQVEEDELHDGPSQEEPCVHLPRRWRRLRQSSTPHARRCPRQRYFLSLQK